tara:strand:- start:1358 stop:1576 length:219 start_codon:yes stop_codon:yes gene_type:complete
MPRKESLLSAEEQIRKIKETKAKYYQNNKDKIKERQNKKYLDNIDDEKIIKKINKLIKSISNKELLNTIEIN